ncbi:MAG: lactonase family protein [Candidatus Latescibacterota bacterium]|nr:lactonase family protein [Candidatus Latescibacterota bacterium]
MSTPLLIVSSVIDEDGLSVFHVADSDGRLELVRQNGGVKQPFYFDVHPNGKMLYSINDPDGETLVAAMTFDRESGAMELINQQSTQGPYPCYVEVDPTGKAVVAANYNGGSVISFPIEDSGALGDAGTFIQHVGSSIGPRQGEAHAHCFKISTDGRFAFAADLGTDQVMIYALDAAEGTLTPGEQPFARVIPGGGPRHFTIAPNNRHAYVINEIGNTVTAFDYDAERGLLLEQGTVTTIPEDFDGVTHTADLCLTPDGRFLYGSNRGHDSLAMYAVDAETGALEPIGIESMGGPSPQNLTMSSDGRLLFVALSTSGKISSYRIDQGTGALMLTHQIDVPSPMCSKLV